MKTPIERVKKLYEKRGRPNVKFGERTFADDFKDYSSTGIVINTPTCFAMLKALEYANGKMAWFVEAAAGKLSEIVSHLPAPMPFVAFCRFNDKHRRMRFYPWNQFVPKLLKLC